MGVAFLVCFCSSVLEFWGHGRCHVRFRFSVVLFLGWRDCRHFVVCLSFLMACGFSHVKVVALSGYQFNDMNGRQWNWLTKIPNSEFFEKVLLSWKLLNWIFAFFDVSKRFGSCWLFFFESICFCDTFFSLVLTKMSIVRNFCLLFNKWWDVIKTGM